MLDLVKTELDVMQTGQTQSANVLLLIPGKKTSQKNTVRDLVYGCWCNGRRIGGMQMPPLNHLFVATTLQEDGHHCTFVDAQLEYEAYEHLERENFAGLDFLVLISSTNSFRDDLASTKYIKSKNPSIKVIFCGSHPTLMPKITLEEEAIDYIVLREPELSTRDLIRRIVSHKSLADLDGCGYRYNGEIVINPPQKFFDMNELPVPNWTLLPRNLDYFNPVVKRMPYATMQTSRGCPAKCIYCSSPFFYGNQIRVKTAENVLKEIRYLVGLGYKEIFFRDETFTAFKARNIEICKAIIEEKIDVTWIANGRVDMIDVEQADYMKRAGCHMLKFGVESGNDDLLVNIKKGASVQQCREAFRVCHEVGLDTHSHIIFGSPGETLETIGETIKFAQEIDTTTASFGIMTPYAGTEHFDMVVKRHPEIKDGSEITMDTLHTTAYYTEAVCDLKHEQLQRMVSKAYRTFYFRPSYLLKWLGKINSMDELFRLVLAGTNIFTFGISGKK
ncbi:MAG: radical SAM protein [Nitrospinota bacterium]|nr:radical SAM protein [Nitrospinota bacterium]